MSDLKILIFVLIGLYIGCIIYKYILRPWLIDKSTKDIETNPKWLTPKLREKYYGLSDMDIVLADSFFGWLPRLRLSKNDRLQLLLPEDISAKDIDEVARIALIAKIKIKYNLWFPDKPAFWLSILCYMLDGGDIKQEATSWEKIQKSE